MGSLDGKKVCVTGKLSESRSAIEGKLKELGASIAKGVTKTTDLLVAGEKAGSKLAKAEKEGIPVIDQAGLDALLGGKSLDEVLGGSAPAKTPPKTPAKAAPKAEPAKAAAPSGKPHEGQVFVLTGELDIDRGDAKRQLVALGARVTGSVSGKTTALLCGDEPGGSKISKAESKGIPVVDKAGVERLLAGQPLEALSGPAPAKAEAPATERTPLPAIPERKDGPYASKHPGSDQVEYEGQFENGQMVGTWKRYWPNGTLQWQVGWVLGQRQGPIEAWHENGEKHYTGEYVDDQQSGEWTYWYDDGAYFQTYFFEKGLKTGDYTCDERDGSPRARGQFVEGKLHGQWEWRNQKDHERVKRGYERGAFTGMSEAWYYGGQLAYRKEYRGGGLCGVFEEYYPDGKPKKIGEYSQERTGLIRMETYAEDGTKTVEEGSEKKLPEKLLRDEKKLAKLAERLKKAKDEYKKDDILEKAAGEWSLKYPLLLHLFREDIYDLGADWELWRFLAENTHLVTGEDVAKLLRTANPKKDMHSPHIPGWPGSLDEMVMRVYAKDPEPIDAVLPELKGKLATGVKFCLARFGKDVKVGDHAKGLAKKMVDDYGIGERILWPTGDGDVDWRDLFHGHRRDEPTEHFAPFLELLTDSDSYEEAVLEAVMQRLEKEYSNEIGLPRVIPAIRRATPEQLQKILDKATLGDETVEMTRKTFFELRDDDADTVTKIALGSEEKGLRRWPMVACAILKRKAEGLDIPKELIDALPIEGVSIATSWIDQAIRAELGTDHNKHFDLHGLARAVRYADRDSPGNPRNDLLVEALRALSEEQLRARLEQQLEEKYAKQNVAPYLFLVDDEDFWKSAIETIAESEYGGGHTIGFGLGLLPRKALPLILAGKKKAQKKNQDAYDTAALLCVTRAAERGEALDATAVKCIRFDVGGKYDWNYVMPMLRKVITILPREHGETVLLEGLNSSNVTTFARAFRFIGAHPSKTVLETAMTKLLEVETKLKSEGERDVEAGLKSLPTMYMNERRAYVKWLMENGGGAKLKNAFKNAIGNHQDFDALEKELAEGGKEVAKELDKVDKAVLLAERARKASKGGTEVIYAFRKLQKAPATPTLNLTGGKPPGIDAESWPVKDDEPMVHLFTLDLETMPELKNPKTDTRSVSFFCWSPSYNEAWEAGNDQTALLKATSDQVGTEHEPPEEAELRTQGHFEAIRIEVPSNVWFAEGGVLGELRGAIYSLGARALGEPLWLQGDEGGGYGYVMQFDESFVDVNLGDMGIMYVFSDGGFWQCH